MHSLRILYSFSNKKTKVLDYYILQINSKSFLAKVTSAHYYIITFFIKLEKTLLNIYNRYIEFNACKIPQVTNIIHKLEVCYQCIVLRMIIAREHIQEY